MVALIILYWEGIGKSRTPQVAISMMAQNSCAQGEGLGAQTLIGLLFVPESLLS